MGVGRHRPAYGPAAAACVLFLSALSKAGCEVLTRLRVGIFLPCPAEQGDGHCSTGGCVVLRTLPLQRRGAIHANAGSRFKAHGLIRYPDSNLLSDALSCA